LLWARFHGIFIYPQNAPRASTGSSEEALPSMPYLLPPRLLQCLLQAGIERSLGDSFGRTASVREGISLAACCCCIPLFTCHPFLTSASTSNLGSSCVVRAGFSLWRRSLTPLLQRLYLLRLPPATFSAALLPCPSKPAGTCQAWRKRGLRAAATQCWLCRGDGRRRYMVSHYHSIPCAYHNKHHLKQYANRTLSLPVTSCPPALPPTHAHLSAYTTLPYEHAVAATVYSFSPRLFTPYCISAGLPRKACARAPTPCAPPCRITFLPSPHLSSFALFLYRIYPLMRSSNSVLLA